MCTSVTARHYTHAYYIQQTVKNKQFCFSLNCYTCTCRKLLLCFNYWYFFLLLIHIKSIPCYAMVSLLCLSGKQLKNLQCCRQPGPSDFQHKLQRKEDIEKRNTQDHARCNLKQMENWLKSPENRIQIGITMLPIVCRYIFCIFR